MEFSHCLLSPVGPLLSVPISHQADANAITRNKTNENKINLFFFADISHEFRTPLTLIKSPLKQLVSGEFSGNIKETYLMMLRNSDRLLGLISQILDLSKLESGEINVQVSETDITAYVRGLVLSFASLAERKRIELKLHSTNIRGFVDLDKLEKILTNLLSNAFKFTPEGGEIIVDCRVKIDELPPPKSPLYRGDGSISPFEKGDKGGCKNNSQVQISNSDFMKISVSNTGLGIPADQLDKVFDRFYQANNHYHKDGEGTGIGLALTKELVEICRGEIFVSSVPDKTTTFTVIVPIAKENFKENEIIKKPEAGDGKPQTGKRVSNIPVKRGLRLLRSTRLRSDSHPETSTEDRASSILIIEDNPDLTEYISSFMANEYRILTAGNGKEGYKRILGDYPDLIISDVMMPEMDGFELCKKVKTDERISHIPVILLTAKADLESKIDGLEFGADDYLIKPFEARELQIRTKNLIDQRRKLREKFSQLNVLNPEDISITAADEKLLQRLLEVFETHIEEPDFHTEDFAREIGMSRMNLNRKLQALANQSTNEFIRSLRLKRAALLLQKNFGTVSEIAYKVGFNSTSHFAKAFRKLYGITPGRFNGTAT